MTPQYGSKLTALLGPTELCWG